MHQTDISSVTIFWHRPANSVCAPLGTAPGNRRRLEQVAIRGDQRGFLFLQDLLRAALHPARLPPAGRLARATHTSSCSPIKNRHDGAREGAAFIRDHIITVSQSSFDDFIDQGLDRLPCGALWGTMRETRGVRIGWRAGPKPRMKRVVTISAPPCVRDRPKDRSVWHRATSRSSSTRPFRARSRRSRRVNVRR
jgi:hypothetical protein